MFAASPLLGGSMNPISIRAYSSSTSDGDLGPSTSGAARTVERRGGGRAALHTGAAAGAGLSDSQQAALASLVAASFQHDPSAAAGVLHRALDDAGRRELLLALGAAPPEAPELSRVAMLPPEANHHHELVPRAALARQQEQARAECDAAAAAAPAHAAGAIPAPTQRQLAWVAFSKGIPFVAFGFFDNIIMITAGEQIDLMFGAKLGLSSMAAAGLGNCVADVVGINISHSIEQRTKRSKALASGLTAAQAALPQTRRAKWVGCAAGMAVGCLLGLTPLLFIDGDSKHKRAPSSGDAGGDGGGSGGGSSGGGGGDGRG